MTRWIEEVLHPGLRFKLEAEKVLYDSRTAHQRVVVFENRTLGRVLTLDDIVQTTERDEFIYHEMLSHVPILAHGAAREVLIVGGGDGGMLEETLKHGAIERVTMDDIDAGVIESARTFRVLAAFMGVGDDLAAGSYEFQAGETALAAVQRISQGITVSRSVTIREGLRAEEIAELMESEGVVTADAFLAALNDEYEASFLAELPSGASLEGFLFPARYQIELETSAHDMVQKLLSAFDARAQLGRQP